METTRMSYTVYEAAGINGTFTAGSTERKYGKDYHYTGAEARKVGVMVWNDQTGRYELHANG